MAVVFIEGFDKYGGYNDHPDVDYFMLSGEWTDWNAAGDIVQGLSPTGYALQGGSMLNKQFYTNYPRLIGGLRFNVTFFIETKYSLIHFFDELEQQCQIVLNMGPVSGVIEFQCADGAYADVHGTVLATYGPIIPYATRYLEWDITFGPNAPFKIWLDGVLIIDGIGPTIFTANSYANSIGFYYDFGGSDISIDDLYLFDTTGSTNNAVLLTNPRIETTFPAADVDPTQWIYGASTLGEVSARRYFSQPSIDVNELQIRPFVVPVNCTLVSVVFHTSQHTSSVSLRPVVYANGTLPETAGALLATGPVITVTTEPGGYVTMPLTTPLSLTAGTTIWLGIMANGFTTGYDIRGHTYSKAGVPFTAGAPDPAPSGLFRESYCLVVFGVLTGVTDSWYVISNAPAKDNWSYLTDLTVGHQDMYTFGPLTPVAETIYTTVLKGYFIKTDVGIRTVTLHTKSGAVDAAGLMHAPHVERYWWHSTVYDTDPNTGARWGTAALNAATSGYKIET